VALVGQQMNQMEPLEVILFFQVLLLLVVVLVMVTHIQHWMVVQVALAVAVFKTAA
jgi:hypothetical protein